jgi:anaerobic selenocysteine-containing dehydrogenase
MDNDEGKSKLSRRGFFGKMAGGMLAASILAPAVAALSRIEDKDFDLDVRLSNQKSTEKTIAQAQSDAVSCGGSCSTCGSTCSSTCGSSCGGTCNGTCVTCGGRVATRAARADVSKFL